MSEAENINKRLTDFIGTIARDFPELYRMLDESPITLAMGNSPELDNKTLEDYLNGLRNMVKQYTRSKPD